LVDFATVSYILKGSEGRYILKIHAGGEASESFIASVKDGLIDSFNTMSGHKIPKDLIDETISGGAYLEKIENRVESSFNLPMLIGSELLALINISSNVPDLYKDEDTKILYTILSQVSASASKLSMVVENEKRRLSAMISSLTDGILMVDPSMKLTVANPALSNMLGIKIETLMEVVAGVGTKADLENSLRTALSKKTVVRIPQADFGSFVVEIIAEPVIDKHGYLLGAAVVFHDITPEKRLEKMRDDFTAMMVHELRTPLTVINYSADSLLKPSYGLTKAETEKNMQVIQSTAGEMLTLVNDLLDVAKIEAGKLAVSPEKNDINLLLKEKTEVFKPQAKQKGINLEFNPDAKIPQFIFDKVKIGQAITNLISNAIKYTDKGTVTISSSELDDHVLVSVKDTGDGIKDEDLHHLFNKFEQFGKGKSGEKTGTGLGLVIVKGIIEAHKGKIWAESEGVGKGSTFIFSLPL
jgi:PAS domain S-box-containing protein